MAEFFLPQGYSSSLFSLSALEITDTELKVMAALAMTTQEKSEEGIERCRATMQQAPL
jgi:hypothetical protein